MADDTLDLAAHVDALRSADIQKRDAARIALSKGGIAAIKSLHAVYFSNVDPLLYSLGADNFRTRKTATKLLIARGASCRAKVEALLKSTTDPEIKFRCKKILEALPKDGADNGLGLAVEIVIGIGEDIPESQRFIDHYFASFESAPERSQDLLPKAIPLCKKNEVLTKLLPKLKKGAHADVVLAAIKTRMPDKAPAIIKEYEDLLFKGSLDIQPIVNEMAEWRSYGNGDFDKVARRIESQPLYEKKRPILITRFLEQKSFKSKALAIRLARESIGPHVPLIVSQIKAFKTDASPMFMFFDKIVNVRTHFLPHVDVFLNSPVRSIRTEGINICHAAPKLHKAKVLALYKDADEYSLAKRSCKFLLQHFPEMRDELQKIAVQRILDIGPVKSQSINALTFVLRDHFNYSGHELDEWWVKWSESKDNYPSHALSVGLRVNVSGRLMMPMAMKAEHLPDDVARHIIKSEEANKETILKSFKTLVGKSVPHYSSIDKVLLDEMPECFDEIFPLIITRVAKETDFQSSFHSILERYAQPIAKKPARAKLIRPYLSHDNRFVRHYAAAILLNALPVDAEARKALRALPTNGNDDCQKALLSDMLDFRIDFNVAKPLMKDIVSRAKDEYHGVRFIADRLDSGCAKHSDFLGTLLNDLVKSGKKTNAMTLARGMLQVDANHSVALTVLRAEAQNGNDGTSATRALEILGQFGRDPKLSLERIRFLYKTCDEISSVNEALSVSKNNISSALPVMVEQLPRSLKKSYNSLDDMFWDNEPAQKALTPGLVAALASTDSTARKNALNVLTCGSCVLKDHMDTLKAVYKEQSDPKFLNSFMWMLSNMETDAAPFAAILPKRFADSTDEVKSHYLFAMSRISPTKEERLKHTKAFITHLNTVPKKKRPYRMLRLIDEFPELTHPIFHTLITEEKEGNRNEAVWSLIKEKPFTSKTIELFELLLKRCARRDLDYDEVTENLCWALRKRLPDVHQFLPLLKGAKPKLRHTLGYRLLMHDAREYKHSH